VAKGVVCRHGFSASDDNGAEDGKADIQLWISLDANGEGRAGKKLGT